MTTLAVFAATYLGLALGRVPGTRLDRAGIALVGGAAMLAVGSVDLDTAAAAIDARTLFLLFGMMVVIAHLRLAGFFEVVSLAVLRRARSPLGLLAATVATSGVLSALFVNDVVCLVLTPLVLAGVRPLGLDAVPFLIAVATASNIGSVATLTGNPQNMLVGSFSGIPYAAFAARLAPAAAAGLVVDFLVLAAVYRRSLARSPGGTVATPPPRVLRPLLRVGLLVSAGLLAAFLAGVPVAVAAVGAGALLLLLGRVAPRRVFAAVDWPLLVLFTGLFVVLAALEQTGLVARAFAAVGADRLENPAVLAGLAALLSNLVSNVPAVLLFREVVPGLADPQRGWLVLAMASTFAGNLTLVGSIANLIVVEQSRLAGGPRVGFVEYLKVGVPVTLVTTLLGVALLAP